MRYLLGAGNTLIVRGAASFKLLNGEATVLGGPLRLDQTVVVLRDKQLPILANSETEFDLTVGHKNQLFEVNGSTIPSSWEVRFRLPGSRPLRRLGRWSPGRLWWLVERTLVRSHCALT